MVRSWLRGPKIRNSTVNGTASRYHHNYIFIKIEGDITTFIFFIKVRAPLRGIRTFIFSIKEEADIKESKKHKGFTLTELLIVLLIMGILAAIAIVSYTAFLDEIKELVGW